MKRLLLSIVAVFALPTTVCAAYSPMSFLELAGTSQAIVVGTITTVEKETYSLKIEDSIVGTVKTGETITVRQFQDWPCAWRWAPYEVGQKVIVFLDFSSHYEQWVSPGAGCEGESPVVNDEVYANFYVPGPVFEDESARYRGYFRSVPFNQLRSAIADFRATYRLTPSKDPWRKDGGHSVRVPFDQIERIVTQPKSGFRRRKPNGFLPPKPRLAFRNRSPLHRHLAETVDEEQTKIEKFKRQD